MLYFDYGTDDSTGSLYLREGGSFELIQSFGEGEEEVRIEKDRFPTFEAFWKDLEKKGNPAFLHPLFVHPEVRPYVAAALKRADFTTEGDARWQGSHQRQWKKVLEGPATYYGG